MRNTPNSSLRSNLFWGVFRIAAVTFLVTLLAFAVSLFFSIAGILLVSMFRVGQVDMTTAYRTIAFPIALAVLAITLVLALITEVRNYRRSRA